MSTEDRDLLRRSAATDLEWRALLGRLGDRCLSEAGRARIERLAPAESLAEAKRRSQLCAEALSAMAAGEPVIARAVPPVETVLARVHKGGSASAFELRDLAQVLRAAEQLRPYARTHREARGMLAAALWSDPSLDDLSAEIHRCIDDDGQVRDDASEALRQARRRGRALRRTLLEEIERLAARYADVLRDTQHVEREGRYALAVRSDAHRRVEGIVLGASSSGATLFVEPRQVTELGNRLTMAESEVEREKTRVLAELSARAAELGDEIQLAYEACIEADVLAALSGFAAQTRSIAIVPSDDGRVELRDARHPLLALSDVEVVPNDIAVASGSALVISGPNAGGKTVALKCLGIILWMARAGLPVPVAEQSHVGWYDQVFTDFGDAQSIERSLSTFSAEVDRLRRIVALAGERTLVLLDEVAGSTDPEEGSALAAALLEALIDRGAAVVVTTHYERLKELAAESDRFLNASVGFDFERMAPTFQLSLGLPGASSALLVATRHGLPEPIVARARQLLPSETVDRQQLLEELAQERQALAEARARTEQESRRVEALRREIEAERKTARQQERKRLAAESESMMVAIREARARLRRLDADLGTRPTKGSLRRAERAVTEAARHVAIGSPLDQALRADPQRPPETFRAEEVRVGALVYVPQVGAAGVVEQASQRGRVRVRVGGMSMRVRATDLRHADERAAAKAARSTPSTPPARAPTGPAGGAPREDAPVRTSGNTCDLRGRRVDEALAELDAFLDRCLQIDEPAGFVLHGHGTGALKRAVREHLAESRLVHACRPAELGEGGDGFTIFWLEP
ncbi:MAG: Smr/MutS family protein [Deltaproteobacteria bacterium]|nr:Smr/MutS family protein [Deltaproteobacteria bacterium]MBW2531979.1 Smr/MutS family protein [Deltaproteobacteria bacterium]